MPFLLKLVSIPYIAVLTKFCSTHWVGYVRYIVKLYTAPYKWTPDRHWKHHCEWGTTKGAGFLHLLKLVHETPWPLKNYCHAELCERTWIFIICISVQLSPQHLTHTEDSAAHKASLPARQPEGRSSKWPSDPGREHKLELCKMQHLGSKIS